MDLALVRSPAHDTAPHAMPLLPAKLAPPDLAHATITRRRLLGQLSRAVQRSPLTQVSGPAGSGKTVLVSTWREAEASSRSIAWLTLDGEDDEPATFWSYVVQALRTVGTPLDDLPALIRGEPLPGGFVSALAAGLGGRRAPVVLVVDNADHLTDRTVIAGLDALVRHSGSVLRLVLCSRADPPLPLHQYRVAGTMSEIRGAQLAFTAKETQEVLAAMGVEVSAEVAERLCAETEGWAVGLRLAAGPLQQGVPSERLVTELAHDDGTVAQYLFAEVLAGQPEGIRDLLLRTSVTEELHPELVDRLTGRTGSRRLLAALAHANSFLEESPGAPGGLRIHPLFREMLTAQLAFDHPGEVAGLHRACALWYAEAGRLSTAVRHALAAEDWALAAQLLVDDLVVLRLLAHGSVSAGTDVHRLPPAQPGPDAAVLRAAVALATGGRPTAGDLAAAAGATAADRPALRFSAALVSLTGAVATGADAARVQVLAAATQTAFAELPEDDRRNRREYLAVLAGARALATLAGDGTVEEVLAQVRAAAAAAHAAGARRLRSHAVGPLAVIEAAAGLLGRAQQHAAEAETLSADAGIDERERPTAAATALASVHLQRYALVEAREWLTRAAAREQHAAAPEPPASTAMLAVLQAQFLRLRREHDVAEATLVPHVARGDLPAWVRQLVRIEAARLALDRGRPAEALRLADDPVVEKGARARLRATAAVLGGAATAVPLTEEAQGGPPVVVVESLLLRACQLVEAGRVPQAADDVERALELARPEALRLPFVVAPPQIRRLLRTHPKLQGPGAWLSTLAAPAGSTPSGAPGSGSPASEAVPLTQELSERETEVLQHLAEMLSTAEIASVMFISVNTVRTHIRSILRKLGVTRRNQAVRRARELGRL